MLLEVDIIGLITTISILIGFAIMINSKINVLVDKWANFMGNNINVNDLSNDSELKKVLTACNGEFLNLQEKYLENKKRLDVLECMSIRLEILVLISLNSDKMVILERYNQYKTRKGNSYIDEVVQKYLQGINIFEEKNLEE